MRAAAAQIYGRDMTRRPKIIIVSLLLVGALPGSAGATWLQPSDAPLDAFPALAAGPPALAYDGSSLVAAWPEAGSKPNPTGLRSARLAPDTHNVWQPLPAIEDGGTIRDVRAAVAGGHPVLAYASQAGASAPSRVAVARLGASAAWTTETVTTGPQRSASEPALAVLDGVPYVARIVDDGALPAVRVASANAGGGWASVGDPLSTGAEPASPALVAVGSVLLGPRGSRPAPAGRRVVRAARLGTNGGLGLPVRAGARARRTRAGERRAL